MEQAKTEPNARRLVEPIKNLLPVRGDAGIPLRIHLRAIGILTAAQRIVNRYYAQG